ncbi:hypothetical protein MMC31_001394, partial [Peltigera leucophlebia]|nr:hypothetical protein [Peltigera leucophlebia]
MSFDESLQIYQFLYHLQKDSLEEIYYTSSSFEKFPFSSVIASLWHHQKNIRNLRFITHLVQWLKHFSQEEGQSDILKFFTYLDIWGDSKKDNEYMKTVMLWPLQNLDLTVLQKLKLSSKSLDPSIFSGLNDFFALGSFVNLTELHFQDIYLSETLTLTRMPSLKSLVMIKCDFQGPKLPLVLTNDIRLSALDCQPSNKVDKFIPLLARANGLQYLIWDCDPDSLADGIDRYLISAIMAQKDTLRELYFLDIPMPLGLNLEARLWDVLKFFDKMDVVPAWLEASVK